MKRLFLLLLVIWNNLYSVLSQNVDFVNVKLRDSIINVIKKNEIDSIVFLSNDGHCTYQTVYTKDRIFSFDIEDIEEVSFKKEESSNIQQCYSIISIDDTTDWDSLLISSRGYYSAVKYHDNGFKTMILGCIGEKDLSKTITAFFDSDNSLSSVVIDNTILHIIKDNDVIKYISYYDNGIPQFITLNDVSYNSATRKNRSGINKSTTMQDINQVISIVNVLKGLGELGNFLPSLEDTFVNGILSSDSSSDIQAGTKLTLSMIGTLTGAGIAIVVGGPEVLLGLGLNLILSAATGTAAYFEEVMNEKKGIRYNLEAGYAEIETLYPINIGNNIFKLGVRVSKTASLPGTGKFNTFGLLIMKEGDGDEDINLYSKGASICMEEKLVHDGEFYIDIHDIEPGYKYFCRAFILPAKEKEKNKIGETSFANNYFSYAYYGDVEEFILNGPKRKLNYKQVSADNKDEDNVHFKMDVEVDIIDFSEEIEKYGVRLYKDDVKYDLSSEIEILYLQSGPPSHNPVWNEGYRKVEIEFDADRDALTINKDLLQAMTKDHWRIETYIQYGRGENAIESKSSQPLDLVYNEMPKAKTLDMTTETQATSAVVKCEYHDYGLWGGLCGVEYWKEDGKHLEKYIDIPKDGSLSIELTDLDPFTSYKYRAFIKVNDIYYRAQETKVFVTQRCKPQLLHSEIIEATFDLNNYHHGDETYSFRFHIATTWKIESLKKIVDWGYKYIDLNNKSEKISLLEFGDFYKDSRYAFYRNSRDSEILVIPYAYYGISSSNSRNNTRGAIEDEDGIIYGDTISIRLLYDKQPEVATLDTTYVDETSARVKCMYKEAAPWGGTCGLEYWEEGNSDNPEILLFEAAQEEIEIPLNDLKPGTTYYYRAFIKIEDEYIRAEEIKSFVTMEAQICPDDHHPHLIDLGLSSGTKWACCNIGASSPIEYGSYYAWGETEEKEIYVESTSQYFEEDVGIYISNTSLDAAKIKWGGGWHMPIESQASELISECDWKWTVYHGCKGMIFTSRKNGNSIFLPAAGQHATSTDNVSKAGTIGHYWLGQSKEDYWGSAWHLALKKNEEGAYTKTILRWRGCPIRAVK